MKKEDSNTTVGRQVLQAELERRCQVNPRYSLRSFAKAIGMSHTQLSLILSGRRPITEQSAFRIAEHMRFAGDELQRFVLRRNEQPSQSQVCDQLTLDQFEVIKNWYHLALLSMVELPNVKWTLKKLATRFNFSESKVKLAMERLERLGLVEDCPRRGFRRTGEPLRFDNKVSTAATRQYHTGILEVAQHALENTNISERDFSATTLLLKSDCIAKMRAQIQRFRRELCDMFESHDGDEQVYTLSVQLFPVSNKGDKA